MDAPGSHRYGLRRPIRPSQPEETLNRIALSCLASAALAGALGGAFLSAASAENCYGLDAARVCVTPNPGFVPTVDPTGGNIHECVHHGSTCTPVDVPYPTATGGGGSPATANCYMDTRTCAQYINDLLSPY